MPSGPIKVLSSIQIVAETMMVAGMCGGSGALKDLLQVQNDIAIRISKLRKND